MNERIKELAIEARLGAALVLHHWGTVNALTDSEQDDLKRIEKFAELVATAEREECAKLCEAGINNATDWDSSYWDQCCENRAAAIRARGQV